MTEVNIHSKKVYAEATEYLAETDPVFGRTIDIVGPCRLDEEIRPMTTTFEALLEAITHQQLSTKAAATIYKRVCALAPAAEAQHFVMLDPS